MTGPANAVSRNGKGLAAVLAFVAGMAAVVSPMGMAIIGASEEASSAKEETREMRLLDAAMRGEVTEADKRLQGEIKLLIEPIREALAEAKANATEWVQRITRLDAVGAEPKREGR